MADRGVIRLKSCACGLVPTLNVIVERKRVFLSGYDAGLVFGEFIDLCFEAIYDLVWLTQISRL